MKPWFKKTVFYSVFGLILLFITFACLEILLRVYNPIPSRIKGDRIVLPINQVMHYTNTPSKKLDHTITHSKNKLGFRGPDVPSNFENKLSIITIGGSTTECFLIHDGKDWSSILSNNLSTHFNQVWVNNAGLDGHSTFGHALLLEDHIVKIKPKYALFLIGCNDIEREDLSDYDAANTTEKQSFIKRITNSSEVVNFIKNLVRASQSKNKHIGHNPFELNPQKKRMINIDSLSKNSINQHPYLNKYRDRVITLINTCIKHNIHPILITQPCLLGKGIDPTTGTNLELYPYGDTYNGASYWNIFEMYNDQLRLICEQHPNVSLIDLGRLLEKDSRYFYDEVHFSNEGCVRVASIVDSCLSPIIMSHHPTFIKAKKKN